ncbi:MAG: cell division protein SepF [Cyanobium sp.]
MAPAQPLLPCLPSKPARPTSRSPWGDGGRPIESPRASDCPTILVLHPQDLADGQRAIEAVRCGQSVVLDASELDPALGQRLVDYTCGGVQAMDGQSRRLGEAVFLFTTALSRIEEGPLQI